MSAPEWRKAPPRGCRTVETHERQLVALADQLEAQVAVLLAPDKDGLVAPMCISRAKEVALAAVRSRKIAADLALERERNQHLDWLIEQKKGMSGAAGTARRMPLGALAEMKERTP
jgi:hypothetical protein